MSNSLGSAKIRSLVTIFRRYRVQSRKNPTPDYHHHTAFSLKSGYEYSSPLRAHSSNRLRLKVKTKQGHLCPVLFSQASHPGNVEKVVDELEIVAEVVEGVATAAEKISSDVADKLPEDGVLKEAALMVEQMSAEAARDAQLTQDFIHKVEELGQDLTGLGTIVKHNMVEKDNAGK